MAPSYKQTHKRPASTYSRAVYAKKPRYAKVAKRPRKISTADAAWTLARKAYSGYKAIKKVLNTEEKVYDIQQSVTAADVGTVFNLFQPAQGDAFNQRDGDSVRPLSLDFKWFAYNNVANTANNDYVRIIIFRAVGERASAPAVTDVLEVAKVDSPQKYSTRDRYNILYDFTTPISPGLWGQSSRSGSMSIPLSGHTLFTAGQITIETGGLYQLVIGAQATNQPLVDYYTRVWFTDT